ncbi:MAG: hypothetical protein BWY11_02021 [Firmicutes bacterium ADurb.Bin182]|nr:MAG: hypothetical protein BWY11_02021 [Firmicutes bacterium ADurb.Bin182]
MTPAQLAVHDKMRVLWEQHVMWTRSFIISAAESLNDLQLVTERLLRNPSDFAAVLRRYYGNTTASKFEEALRNHLLIAADLVNSAKAGNTAAVEAARRKWYDNADTIAAFLAGINPYWPEQEWRRLLYGHLRTTEQEAVYRLNKQYARDIAIYDTVEAQALEMADLTSRGIIEQFGI